MDVSHVVVRKGIHSGVGHVVLEVTEHSAQNRIVVIPGANRTLTVEEVAWIQQTVSGFDMVLLQLEVPIEVNRAVARWAREAGVPVILNPAPATELDDELLSLVSYLIPNEQEASQETHLPLRFDKSGPWDEDLRNIADTLQGKGVEHVIITLGSYGSAVAETGGPRYVPCVHMEHVADPTAAGDSFVGALSTALAVGLPEDAALTFASHTAAITVSRLGAMPSLPTLPEVLELIRTRGGAGLELSCPGCAALKREEAWRSFLHFARAATGILRATNMSCCMWPATRRLWSRWWSTGLCMESGACGCVLPPCGASW